jgi:hypothetical protein
MSGAPFLSVFDVDLIVGWRVRRALDGVSLIMGSVLSF